MPWILRIRNLRVFNKSRTNLQFVKRSSSNEEDLSIEFISQCDGSLIYMYKIPVIEIKGFVTNLFSHLCSYDFSFTVEDVGFKQACFHKLNLSIVSWSFLIIALMILKQRIVSLISIARQRSPSGIPTRTWTILQSIICILCYTWY